MGKGDEGGAMGRLCFAAVSYCSPEGSSAVAQTLRSSGQKGLSAQERYRGDFKSLFVTEILPS